MHREMAVDYYYLHTELSSCLKSCHFSAVRPVSVCVCFVAGGFGKGLLSWMAKPITDSGNACMACVVFGDLLSPISMLCYEATGSGNAYMACVVFGDLLSPISML